MPLKSLKELDATEGTVRLYTSSPDQHLEGSHAVLVPQPSADPNDPLRWPTWRKHMAFLSVCLFSCLNNFSGTVLSDSFLDISEHLGVTVEEASGLISWVILISGLGNFFWVPTAIYLGKRPVFLVSCGITFLAAVWAALSPDFKNLQAACIVGGFGGGASEALGVAIINDIYFLHERGSRMAWSMIAIAFGSSLGPLCGGYLIERRGWAWGKWLSAILLGFNLLMIFFFTPETRFLRGTMPSAEENSNDDKLVENHTETVDCVSTPGISSPAQRKPFLQLLNPWSGVDSHQSYLALMLRPIPLLFYPACAFAVLAYSICLAPTVMVNVLSSTILVPPPYNFSIGAVGLINVPGMMGQAIGAVIGGKCIDIWAANRARRNDGVHLPETRLALIIIPSSVVFTGILLFGFAVEKHMHWAVIFTAYGLMSVGLTGCASIAMTYVCDSYYPVAAECLEIINGLKNVVAFGFVHASVPWVDAQGYTKSFGILSGIFCAFLALVVPLLLWGARIRHHTSTKWRLISWEIET